MSQSRSARQFGTLVVLLTLLFRLFEIGIPQRFLRSVLPQDRDLPLNKKTGLPVRSFSMDIFLPIIPESAPPADAQPIRPDFRVRDAEKVRVLNTGNQAPDLGKLMDAPLTWQLVQEAPTVLILHTHTTESYSKSGETYTETAAYRTLDEDYNLLSVGDRVAQLLEAGGVHVLHDRELHDYPSYNGAYNHARKSTAAILEAHPEIQLVLDIHRDAAESGKGQLRTVAAIDGQEGAQLMFVLGCGNAGLPHPDWEENLSAALKLQLLLEQETPGITRPIDIRPQRFNQDLGGTALLVEIGAAGNSHQEAILAAEKLAEAILELKNGSV